MNKNISKTEKAAREYAKFNPDTDPNDSDERYFNKQKCEIYDAFMAGYKFHEKQIMNNIDNIFNNK